ncbi:MAG: NAD(P)H-hydrate dehydratase [candidate division KSB1 bacterium]|nr:NAD(P)H-hydrate dehydratase [candidate division KSB1 bacterium]MDZ7333575.1 NAD(P)H-hydrate dehydratase [candidate division KSB1 bacterium]MDZ7357020.1 NAD(P)H-hydrate dehydratase [candidate division KSB1 bacterium]MDZ7398689.1 NAD(P)H-hydrate dehydratase [candidate division KSB1 bacterium]
MKIVLNATEMAAIDRTTIEEYQIPGVVLMENAGRAVFIEIEKYLGTVIGKHIVIFCGKGNNGGDGYVIARHLANRGARLSVFLAGAKNQVRGDALVNLTILNRMGIHVQEITSVEQIPPLGSIDLVVDALLGTGVTGPVVGFLGQLIDYINHLGAPIISVDLPSGMETDSGAISGSAIHATLTVTMGHLKTGLLFSPGRDAAGKIVVADISIPTAVSRRFDSGRYLVEADDIRQRLPVRALDAHKTSCGKVVVIAGSIGMTGAATLASLASLKVGAGLTKLAIPASLNAILEEKLTEVMTVPMPETSSHSISLKAQDQIAELLDWADVLAIGPGLSTHPETVAFVHWLLRTQKKPMVLDADGLNAIAKLPNLIKHYSGDLIITPHPGEFARLISANISEIQLNRLNILRQYAKEWNKVIVFKGGPTVVAAPSGDLFINSTGNPGMATGGSGDVLTGMIAGLLAQKLSPTDAALVGVYLHGLAGDLAAESLSQMGMIAGDICDYIPTAIKRLTSQAPRPATSPANLVSDGGIL